MVTLLLTFFVMLLSLASMQDPELFGRGRESFMESMQGLGLGTLFGRKLRPDFGNIKIKYFIKIPDQQYFGRSIDAKEENARRIYKSISKHMQTIPSQIKGERTSFSVANIRFAPHQAGLSESAKKSLTGFCINLQQALHSRGTNIYVLGLAGEEASEKDQWILSAKRAEAAADFLRGACGSTWPVYSWGAGPGGEWVEKDGVVSRETHILIAVLKAG
jgi:outer membrane protein OmpA-like peptidoglycan-associated protein